MTSPKEQSLVTLNNIFAEKDKLMDELSLLEPINLDISDMNIFLDLFYEKNPYPEIILYFTPEISAQGGVTAEFDIFKDLAKNNNYFCVADINISNEKDYSFSFFIANNDRTVVFNQEIFVELNTKDPFLCISAFFSEYKRLEKLFSSIVNDTI